MLQPISFKGLRRPPGYPDQLNTLGDHLRAVRINRKQRQKDVAIIVGVNAATILNWELNRTEVTTRYFPKVMQYLGYCPLPKAMGTRSLGALVRLHRVYRGLSLREAAQEIGADPGALSAWECGHRIPSLKSQAKMRVFIGQMDK